MRRETDFAIRPAEARDLGAILTLERQTPTAAHWSEEQYRRMFPADANRTRLAIVAEPASPALTGGHEPKSSILGFLVARAVGFEWELENLVVAPSMGRRGLGKRLIAELIACAHAQGARSIFLEVRESNLPARALYENAGFAPHGRRNGYYANPPEDALIYRLGLN